MFAGLLRGVISRGGGGEVIFSWLITHAHPLFVGKQFVVL